MKTTKPKLVMKFGDMPCGTHFQERCKKPRKFVKMQNHAGVIVDGKYSTWKTTTFSTSGRRLHGDINSVDMNGHHAICPDWLEFEVTKLGKCFCKAHPEFTPVDADEMR